MDSIWRFSDWSANCTSANATPPRLPRWWWTGAAGTRSEAFKMSWRLEGTLSSLLTAPWWTWILVTCASIGFLNFSSVWDDEVVVVPVAWSNNDKLHWVDFSSLDFVVSVASPLRSVHEVWVSTREDQFQINYCLKLTLDVVLGTYKAKLEVWIYVKNLVKMKGVLSYVA